MQTTFAGSARVFLTLVALLVTRGVVNGAAPAGDSAHTLPAWFVLAPGARHVRYTVFQGKDQLTYSVDAPYPARSVLALISKQLSKQGWKGLKEDWLNPGLPTSLVRGWTYFSDDAGASKTSVRAWQADWENSQHEILTYILQYRCPGDSCSSTDNLRELRVIAVHIPADLARRIKASLHAAKWEHR